MYKIYFFLFCAVVCISCGKKYKIEGVSSVSSLDGKMLFIKVPSGNKMVKVDSTEVIHGLFKVKGKVDSVRLASLFMDEESIMPFVLEEGDIEININSSGISIKGTPLNNAFNAFILKKNSLDDRAYEVERMESRMIMDGKDPEEIQREITRLRKEVNEDMDSLLETFIQANYENVLGPGVFIMLGNAMPYPFLTPLMENIVLEAPESFKNNPMVKEYVSVARSNMVKLQGN